MSMTSEERTAALRRVAEMRSWLGNEGDDSIRGVANVERVARELCDTLTAALADCERLEAELKECETNLSIQLAISFRLQEERDTLKAHVHLLTEP